MFPPDQTAELDPSRPDLAPVPKPANDANERSDVHPAQVTSDAHEVPADEVSRTDDLSEAARQAQLRAAENPWYVGEVIQERYVLERKLGSGAMGDVFLARDRLLKKPVALKVLRSDLAENRETVRRFLREVALAHSVTHPNVVRIFDTGEAGGLPFLSMEFLHGQPLDELIDDGRNSGVHTPPMSLREIREIGYEILSGLEAAHQAGVVHRDLKPANVMLTHRGAIVMDFGVAGFDALPAPAQLPDPSTARSLVATEAGTIFGSPAYMAPELWEGSPATVQSDLYSFAVMLYQMLAGKLPLTARNPREFLEKLRSQKPDPIRTLRKDTPWNMVLLIQRCMNHDPDARPQSAAAAANLLAPLARRRRRLAVAAAAFVTAAGLGTWALAGSPHHESLGLPDEVAAADLAATIRAFDVGDARAVERGLERLEARAPRSAAVAFWGAAFDHERGDPLARAERCANADWEGSDAWVDRARHACEPEFALSLDLRESLLGGAGVAEPALLPLAVQHSLVPRLEVARDPNEGLRTEAAAVLARLQEGVRDHGEIFLAVRWRLAEVDLHVARGNLDEARRAVEEALADYPRAPAVIAKAAWLHGVRGERERAHMLGLLVEEDDPRPALREELEAGKLQSAGERVDVLSDHPFHASMLDMWCGFAWRFELSRLPARCEALSPGLTRGLWANGGPNRADAVAMSPLERDIAARQQAINLGECLDRGDSEAIVTHARAPFESYRIQLDIGAASCPHQPESSNPGRARALTEGLNMVMPGDPWAALLDAQMDDTAGARNLALSKRSVVAQHWAEADTDLPLVRRLRQSVGPRGPSYAPPDAPTPEPAPEPEPSDESPSEETEGEDPGEDAAVDATSPDEP